MIRFFRRRPWAITSVAAPWGSRRSLYQHLREQFEVDTGSPGRADVRLPDEDEVATSPGGLRWVAGGLDGAFGHHAGGDGPDNVAREVVEALFALTREATDDRARALYTLVTAHPAIEFGDDLLVQLAEKPGLLHSRVHAIARWLMIEAPHREAVKAGIILLGAVSAGEDRQALLTLGRHDEFTLFAAVAIQRTEMESEPLLWELARQVTGWGRIHLVERLADTRDERIKSWLLREGCHNDIMSEYTALVCAQTGDLCGALRHPDPDEALMKGAGTILVALIRGGPAAGMEEYDDGPNAVQMFLRHTRAREADLERLNVVALLARFLQEQSESPEPSAARWRASSAEMLADVQAIKARPDWLTRIHQGLASSDQLLFATAAEAAGVLGVDTWDTYFERLLRGESQWFFVMETDNPARVDKVIAAAEQLLPLSEIATGSADELGIGPEYAAHTALTFVLQGLRRFPGKGWPLVRTGLQSPVTGNRNMAVRALAAWDGNARPAEAESLLRQAMQSEPSDHTRELMRKVLDGEPLEV